MRKWVRSAKAFALPFVAVVAVAAVPLLAQDGQWLMYSGNYNSHRFSPLTEIKPDNVARLSRTAG